MKTITTTIFILFLFISPQKSLSLPNLSTGWAPVDTLLSKGLNESACDTLQVILNRSIDQDNQDNWTTAMIHLVQIRLAMNHQEAAALLMLDNPWPTGLSHQAPLNLYYGLSLQHYLKKNHHKIRNREPQENTGATDLKIWTLSKLETEINRSFSLAWSSAGSNNDDNLIQLKPWLEAGTYPDRITGTAKDAIAYLWVQHLRNASFWTVEHHEERKKFSASELLSSPLSPPIDLSSPQVHPLQRISQILNSLSRYHSGAQRPEAALEAQLMLMSILDSDLKDQTRHETILKAMTELIENTDPDLPWWSKGMWNLGVMHRDLTNSYDNRIHAWEYFQKGSRRHPDSRGGGMCLAALENLQRPDYSMEAMTLDGPGKRSIRIQHRNLSRIYFRAWKIDIAQQVKTFDQARRVPYTSYSEDDELINNTKPDLVWSQQVPDPLDYHYHYSYASLPDGDPGTYLVITSLWDDFREEQNSLASFYITNSEIVLGSYEDPDGLRILALSAKTGNPLSGVDLTVWLRVRNTQPELQKFLTTDQEGLAFLSLDKVHMYRVFATHGAHSSFMRPASFRPVRQPRNKKSSFVYSDRPIHRPGQDLQWKVVAFESTVPGKKFETRPNMPVTVSLYDPNHQVVASEDLLTNDFGSVSGTFKIPHGSMLGQWQLKDSLGGHRNIRVEEYKRPTFEVTLNAPDGESHLGETVRITGESKYYFGQPVAGGQFTWVVSRRATTPQFWRWGWHPAESPTLAEGQGTIAADGTFAVDFLASPESDLEEYGIESYQFELSVQVVNQGGESKSVSRNFNVGLSAVKAKIKTIYSLAFHKNEAHFKIRRTDLNKVPRPGHGVYSISKLQPPAEAILPADLPAIRAEKEPSPYATAGDNQRPRWASDNSYMLQMSSWPEGEIFVDGKLEHDLNGWASFSAPDLKPGAYRLAYETHDLKGIKAVVSHDFVVLGDEINNLPFRLHVFSENDQVKVGQVARFFVCSGFPDQRIQVSVIANKKVIEERIIIAGIDPEMVEVLVTEKMRGGVFLSAHAFRDYQYFANNHMIKVPWDNKKLDLEIVEMKEHLRCGDKETIRLKVRGVDGRPLDSRTTELLAYMYDRSLDSLASHHLPRPGNLYSSFSGIRYWAHNISHARHDKRGAWWKDSAFPHQPLIHQRLVLWRFGVHSRPGRLYAGVSGDEVYDSKTDSMIPMVPAFDVEGAEYMVEIKSALSHQAGNKSVSSVQDKNESVRDQFAETAFFIPHLQVDTNGEAVIEFQVPQTVTDWKLELHALTKDLRYGSLKQTVTSSKELLVRPYLPRFLREGDQAKVKVVLNNNTDKAMDCLVDFTITDEAGGEDITHLFGLQDHQRSDLPVLVPPHGEADLMFELDVPSGVGLPTLKVVGRHRKFSDGEQHVLPILPSRMHLQQSQFVSLDGTEQRDLVFQQMNKMDDPTLLNEKLVVTIDAQLFQSTLAALPYLVSYPHECTEQTLNRFLSSSILSSVFKEHPEAEAMAQEFSKRETQLKPWEHNDPNRKILLEETPWLNLARGGNRPADKLINLLDPDVVRQQEIAGLKQLKKLQTNGGGFPWFEGGNPSPYLTLYVLQGFARGQEFGLEIPARVSTRAKDYLSLFFHSQHLERMKTNDTGWNLSTYLVSLMSSFPGQTWDKNFSPSERDFLLDFSFRHWLKLSRMMKVHLSLALWRNDRPADARMVLDSVMDLAETDRELGTYWPAEDRSWLWTRDTIESHALTLRAMCEVYPGDPRTGNLVKWLLLNRHLNQWKSTRATAEAIYALAHFMQLNGTLNEPQLVVVETCQQKTELKFSPEKFSGMDNHLVLSPQELSEAGCGTVSVESKTPGIVFASATWHFSTEELPAHGEGDLLKLERQFFLRTRDASGWKLQPLENGHRIEVGDQVEVQLSVQSRFPTEYIHLRDPRPAGFEPFEELSGRKWEMGLQYYREIRDNGVNYFVEFLPEGEFQLKHRMIANVAGIFRTGPATLQSMYAPEFTAYSSGASIVVGQ